MELSIFWTKFAKDKLRDIFEHYKHKSGSTSVPRKLVNSIVNHTIDLAKQPYIGQMENLLSDRPQEFRYLIHKNYKIIYWINKPKNRIDITHVFDTRQNPHKMTEMLRDI